jgi:hypothetical protein
MRKDFCPECGHMLPKRRTACSFCGWIQDYDPQKDIVAGFNKEIEYLYGYDPPDYLSFDPVAII